LSVKTPIIFPEMKTTVSAVNAADFGGFAAVL
jgi:hypothetical protein